MRVRVPFAPRLAQESPAPRAWKQAAAGLLALALAGGVPAGAMAATATSPYAQSIFPAYDVVPLLSTGDQVPKTGDPSLQYQMVGIPDGMGAHANPGGTVTVYVNHELGSSVLAEPMVGQPLNRGAFVSRLTLDRNGKVISAERAYDLVYNENTLVGPAAQSDNDTPAFSRFCAGVLVTKEDGFDRPIYFYNEESYTGTFDGMGGVTVAIFDHELHALPKLGHFAKESSLPMPDSGRRTVILSLEDGPETPDSQLYMYVGTKKRGAASVLARNGLDNGKLYVFAAVPRSLRTEADFRNGTIVGNWVEVPKAESLDAEELEAFADQVDAFGFVRIEDGAFSKTNRNDFFFVTTGDSAEVGNALGRLYHLRLNPADPRRPATLSVVYNADEVIARGGDIAISPDNIDVSEDYLMIQEDGTGASRAVMEEKGRDGSIWRFALQGGRGRTRVDAASATRIVELAPPGRDGIPVSPGRWETSGIIDSSELFGEGSWLFDVQAHRPTTPPDADGDGSPDADLVEDGQILLLRSR